MACEELYLLKRSVEIPRLVFFGPSWPADDIKGMQNNRHTNVHAHTNKDVHACNVLFVTLKRKKKGEREREKGQPRKPPVCTQCIEYFKKLAPSSWASVGAKRASRDVNEPIISQRFQT